MQICKSFAYIICIYLLDNKTMWPYKINGLWQNAVHMLKNLHSSQEPHLQTGPCHSFKDRAHLSTFKVIIFEKFSCFIVLVVLLVIVQSSELISVWFCEKWHFFQNFISYHIFAMYVGGASLGLPTACRLIAVSGARLPSVDGLVVRFIKMYHHVKSAITICLQFISNMFR